MITKYLTSYSVVSLISLFLVFHFLNISNVTLSLVFLVIALISPPITYWMIVRGSAYKRNSFAYAALLASINGAVYTVFSTFVLKQEAIVSLSNYLEKYNSENMQLTLSITGVRPILTIWFICFFGVLVIGKSFNSKKSGVDIYE